VGPLHFYYQWLNLAWGAALWTRTINGTLTIFLPLAYWIPSTGWFQRNAPTASNWFHHLPDEFRWLPLVIFGCFFLVRLVLAPYWLYRDKPRPASAISRQQAEDLTALWRNGSRLYEKRVQSNPALIVWQHEVREWASTVHLKLSEIDPGEAFAFESIGFEHRQNQNRNEDAQYASIRAQLGERLAKLRRVTGRHLQNA